MDAWSDEEQFIEKVTEPSNIKEKCLWAAETGKVDVLEDVLIEDESVLSYRDNDGYTALHRAASEGHKNVTELLLHHNVNISARTVDGWSPLHCACKWNNVDVAQLLLQNGADINSKSNGNVTPLHVAASEKNSREVLLLLLNDETIDINILNQCDETAYDIAKRLSRHSHLFAIAASHINIC